jgi:hypothetical protein
MERKMPSLLEFNTQEERDLYDSHVIHYLDTQIPSNIMQLEINERNRALQMLHDYADILEKLFVPGIDILEHIQGKRFAAANANPHEGIDYQYDCPIIRLYEEWKPKAGLLNGEPQ